MTLAIFAIAMPHALLIAAIKAGVGVDIRIVLISLSGYRGCRCWRYCGEKMVRRVPAFGRASARIGRGILMCIPVRECSFICILTYARQGHAHILLTPTL